VIPGGRKPSVPPRSIVPVAYRELPQPDGHVACLWVADAPAPETARRVLPDACVDIVWVGDRLVVAGPATGPAISRPPPGANAVGVRFRVGAAGAALGLPAKELLDASVPIADVWGDAGVRLEEEVATATDPAARLAALAAGVTARLPHGDPDPEVRAAAAALSRPATRVEQLERAIGIGDRHLRRRFAEAVGYGPKTLQRILRFQRFLRLAQEPAGGDLSRLALDAGYADQAHLTRECGRLSGLTPAALLASGAGPAGERSDSFKTARPAGVRLAA
jgi:AraC-like DNA-binding protein